MAVWQRWTLGCIAGCALWSLPWWFAVPGFLLSGIPLWLLLRPVVGRSAWVLAATMTIYVVLAIPLGVVVGVLTIGDSGAGFVLAPLLCGGLLGALHASVLRDRGGLWVALGALAGPSVWLVVIGWQTGIPTGVVPGALYGLLTCRLASRAIGVREWARP